MLRSLVNFSLRFRGVVLVLACVAIGYGIFVAHDAKLDVFPSFVQPQVAVQTESPGLSPEQVELLVTVPIETTISGLGDMESLRSESIQGLSIITAVFKQGTDVFRARQTLAESLTETAGKLPSSVKAPRMTPLTSSTMDLLKIGLVSDKLSPMELRTFADWTLKPRLLSVPGVAKCSTYGGEVRQLQILVSPERLAAFDLSLSDVLAAARLSTGVMGAGFIESRNQRITLQTEGESISAQALGKIMVSHTNGLSIRIKDVAQVIEAAEPKYGDTRIQGRPGVLLTMSSQYGANTMEATKALELALNEMKPVFEKQGIQLYGRLHRPATFIEVALRNMEHSLWLGAILVAVVLFLMLGSVRTAFISLTAIPLSLLTAVVVLEKMGITLNTITLGGLAIALGEVVDDSIIDVENIFRRLREYQLANAAKGLDAAKSGVEKYQEIFKVVLDASMEVRGSVVYATFIVVLVFVPVLTLTGLQGSFFAPLALAYILAILASLLVALTVTPAMAFILFDRGVKRAAEPWLQRVLKTGYAKVLGGVARWPRLILGVILVLCILALLPLKHLGGGLLPEFQEGHFVLQMTAAPGTSLPEMLRMGERISGELLKNKFIDTVEQQAGRAELGEDPWGPNRCEIHVELKQDVSGDDQEKIPEQIRAVLQKFPGIDFEVTTFLGDRISETVTGETAPVVVNIFGDDLDVLDAKANEVSAVLKAVPGNADVKVKSPPGVPRMTIRLRQERVADLGFRPVEVIDAVQTAFQGTVVAETHRANQLIGVAVILELAARQDPETIGSLLLSNSQGTRIPLGELADIFPGTGRNSILHEGARRRQTVTCTTAGRDVSSFVDEAKKAVAERVKFPAGAYSVFSGAAQARDQAQRQLLIHSSIAAVGILMLLSIVLHSSRNLLLVLVNIPFALVGGVLAVWLSSIVAPGESSLTIGSLVGFVTLFGITTRNTIMLISHFEHLVNVEGMSWGAEAALRGASERLMPILITAVVTALGLLPLALGAGEAGREIEGPMAIVILGGLITSTALNLLAMPTLALRYGRFGKAN
jgi:CzcA family heavy metal efflux pump